MAKSVGKGEQSSQIRKENVERETVSCVIKCAARKALIESEMKEDVLAKFRENSIKCTRIARLASLLIHFVFNKIMDTDNEKTINAFFNITDDNRPKNSPTEQFLKDYFYGVTVNYTHSPEYPMQMYAPEFREMMEEFGVEPTDNRYMDNTFKHMYQQYSTNFKNNIVEHAEKRIGAFLKRIKYRLNPVPQDYNPTEKKQHRKQNNTAVYKTKRFLFEGTVEFDNAVLNEFERILKPNIKNLCGIFDEMKKDWFKFLPMFFRLQRHIFSEQMNGVSVRNFVIVPQTTFQRRHIQIDTTSLYCILGELNRIEMKTKTKRMPMSNYTGTPGKSSKLWAKIIDENNINTQHKHFTHSIFTDGVAISFCCEKTIVVQSDEEYLAKCKKKLDDGEFDDIAGYDPGMRLVLGRRGAEYS